jgi:hypothetical protein
MDPFAAYMASGRDGAAAEASKPTDGRCNKAPSHAESENWSAAHHAADAVTYSFRASRALEALMTGNTVTKITLPDADGNKPTNIVVPLSPQTVPGEGGGGAPIRAS